MPENIEIRTGFYPIEFEVETRRRGSRVHGSIPYRSRAVINNKGRVRKEELMPGSLSWSISQPDRNVQFLAGHSYDAVLASQATGTLKFLERKNSLDFEAKLPPDKDMTTAQRDAVINIRSGLYAGVSPAFIIDDIPNAVKLTPEFPGSDLLVRQVFDARLIEISAVALAAYKETSISVRQKHHEGIVQSHEEIVAWL